MTTSFEDQLKKLFGGCHDGMVVEFTTTQKSVPITTNVTLNESRSWQGVLDTTLCDKVCL